MINRRSKFFNLLVASISFASFPFGLTADAKTTIPWEQHKFATDRKNVSIAVAYPFFKNKSSEFRKLNSVVKKTAHAEFRTLLSEHSSDSSGEPRGQFRTSFRVRLYSPDAVSITCNSEDYSTSAATSSVSLQTFNYALHSFRELRLKNLFKAGSDYQSVLKVLCLRGLYAITDDADWSCRAAKYDLEDFAVDKQGLLFFFVRETPNEVITVSIPAGQVSQLMDTSVSRKFWTPEAKMDARERFAFSGSDVQKQLAIVAIGTYSKMIDANLTNADFFSERASWYKKLGREQIAARDLETARLLRNQNPQTTE